MDVKAQDGGAPVAEPGRLSTIAVVGLRKTWRGRRSPSDTDAHKGA